MNALASDFKIKANKTAKTANGAASLHSSLNSCVDFFSKSAACRGNEEKAVSLFKDAYKENRETALRTLFYTRDIRGGQGERDIFKACFLELEKIDRETARLNLAKLPEYGRWDDLFMFKGTSLEKDMVSVIINQLENDIASETPSLLAKWMSSANASSKETRKMGKFLAKSLGLSEREYRKFLSKLRSKISIVEQNLSQKDYDSIEYSKIPSKAGLKYRKAFARNDADRYGRFLSDVQNGKVKINTGVLYPYEIIGGLSKQTGCNFNFKHDEALQTMWENLPNYLEGNEHNGLVMADVSDSMLRGYRGIGVAPILVSLSLALYISERNTGDFKDLFMSFSDSPKLYDCSKGNLYEKLKRMASADWGMTTNIEAGFKEILKTAVNNNTPQSELPEVLYIVSDMQFDFASRTKTNFEVAKKNYKKYGYTLPKIVFWNVNASSDQPVTFDENGTALVSGCTPNIFKSILSNNTPEEVMNSIVYSERYDNLALS